MTSQSAESNDGRTPLLEIVVVSLIVVLGAFYARSESIPTHAERHVEGAAAKYELEITNPHRWFSAWSIGDGQAFAVIAADPSGMKLSREIKEPVYRFSRAGYGWLTAIASLGQEHWIPYAMAAVGAAAVMGTLGVAVWLRSRLGPRAWLLTLNPALYIGFAGDTAEPTAILLLAIGLGFSGAVWASLALGVTRPTYLLALFHHKGKFLLGLAAAALLVLYAIVRFDPKQIIPDGGRIGLPVVAFFEHPSLSNWVLLAAASFTLVIGLRTRDWAWALCGLLVVSVGADVTRDWVNAWRAAGMLPVLWAFGPGHQTEKLRSSPRLGGVELRAGS